MSDTILSVTHHYERDQFVRPYPPDFRAEAVQLVQAGGKKLSDIARDLGVTPESLRHWVKQQEVDGESGMDSRRWRGRT